MCVIICGRYGFVHGKHWLKGIDFQWKNQQLYKWSICNELAINIETTYFILVRTVNKPVPGDLTEVVATQMTIRRTLEWHIWD